MIKNIKALKTVLHSYKLSRKELEELTNKKLKEVFSSAYQYVPFYRKLMNEIGYNPDKDFRDVNDLKLFPIIGKKTIKHEGINNFLMEGIDYKNCFTDTTSGSSGIPFRVYRSPDERALQVAKWLRVFFLNGYNVTDKVLSFTSPKRLDAGKSIIQKFGILRRHAVDFTLTPTQMTDEFINYKPQVMYGNRSHIDLIAKQLVKRKVSPKDWGFKLLVVTAEILRESSRKLYKEAYGAEIIESYGTVELGVMAFETSEHKGLKLSEDLTYFEFLNSENKPAAEGELCKIITTDLSGKLMPFIRYDHGDWVIYKKLPNGERRITEIKGRDDDMLQMPDGSIKTFHNVAEVIKYYEEIFEFRFVQNSVNEIELYIVADKDYIYNFEDEIILKLKKVTDPSINYKIISLKEMLPDQNGKIRKIVSNLPVIQ